MHFRRRSALAICNSHCRFAKQTDVKIWSGINKQAYITPNGKLISNMNRNIQIIRTELIIKVLLLAVSSNREMLYPL